MVFSSWSFPSSAGSFLFLPPFSKTSSAPLRNSRFQVLSCWGASSYFWASSASVDRSFNNSKTTLVLNFGVNFLLVVITVNLRINCNLIYCPLFWGMLRAWTAKEEPLTTFLSNGSGGRSNMRRSISTHRQTGWIYTHSWPNTWIITTIGEDTAAWRTVSLLRSFHWLNRLHENEFPTFPHYTENL